MISNTLTKGALYQTICPVMLHPLFGENVYEDLTVPENSILMFMYTEKIITYNCLHFLYKQKIKRIIQHRENNVLHLIYQIT